MRRQSFILCILFLLCGCSRPSLMEQACLLGDREFTPQAWRRATQVERGEMLASFFAKHQARHLMASQVEQLLGVPTGYTEYDEDPAYFIGPLSVESKYGKGYLLVFIADKQTGRIVDIRLLPEVVARDAWHAWSKAGTRGCLFFR